MFAPGVTRVLFGPPSTSSRITAFARHHFFSPTPLLLPGVVDGCRAPEPLANSAQVTETMREYLGTELRYHKDRLSGIHGAEELRAESAE
jgi:hypothetical protein